MTNSKSNNYSDELKEWVIRQGLMDKKLAAKFISLWEAAEYEM